MIFEKLRNQRGSLPRRSIVLISVGILLIVLLFFYGPPIYFELTTPKVIGDGDSLMAGSGVLERLRNKLEAESGHTWLIQNYARGGNRMGIEVARDQQERFFTSRLPWKTKDKIWVIGGTNDLVAGGPDRVERLLDAVQNYFQRQQHAGYTQSMCFYTDVLPRDTATDPSFEGDRRRYNSLIAQRLAGLAHVIPSGSNPLLADPLNRDIFYDGIHLTHAGNEILAADAFRVMREVASEVNP